MTRTALSANVARALCAWCCVVLLAVAPLVAQSGRNRPQSTETTPPSQATRPRVTTPTTTPSSSPAPQAQETPAPSAPVQSNSGNTSSPVNTTGTPAPVNTTTPASSSGREDDIVEVDEAEVVRVNSNLVPVPASVLDSQGRAVTDLGVKDFELRVDGEVKPISEVSFAETPVSMAVLFDNSSSLIAGREFEKQAAIRFFRSVLRPSDRAALYSVSTVPTLVLPLTSDVKALVRTIDHFPNPEGATALFDAIAVAAEYLRPHGGRKVIVIVSDGVDTISDLGFDETLKRAQAADCQIYAVQTGHSDSTNLRDLAAERRLQEFASQTGGAVYVPRSTSDLGMAFSQIAADLSQQYVLSYYPSDERHDGRFRAFSLRVTTRPNVRVRTRKGYYPPKG